MAALTARGLGSTGLASCLGSFGVWDVAFMHPLRTVPKQPLEDIVFRVDGLGFRLRV